MEISIILEDVHFASEKKGTQTRMSREKKIKLKITLSHIVLTALLLVSLMLILVQLKTIGILIGSFSFGGYYLKKQLFDDLNLDFEFTPEDRLQQAIESDLF